VKKSDLLKLLDNLEFHPGKILGQNFLIDDNLLDFIIRSSNPSSGDEVLEVGPGFGVLTRKLLQA
jgi:16S rRNA (adenine1518-N6/adenine1519-N6)-dimethyltransferase